MCCRVVSCHPHFTGSPSLPLVYSCCGRKRGSDGCTTAKVANHNPHTLTPSHLPPPLQVHITAGNHLPREAGYVQTCPYPATSPSDGAPPPVLALNCKMCYTSLGLQLTRVSVIGIDPVPLYNCLVMPSHPIVDYNTRCVSHSRTTVSFRNQFVLFWFFVAVMIISIPVLV